MPEERCQNVFTIPEWPYGRRCGYVGVLRTVEDQDGHPINVCPSCEYGFEPLRSEDPEPES